MGCTPSKSAVNTVVPVSTLALSPSSNINNTAVSTKSKHYHHHALTHPVNPNVNGHHQNASDSANSYTAKSIIADYPIVPPSAETINAPIRCSFDDKINAVSNRPLLKPIAFEIPLDKDILIFSGIGSSKTRLSSKVSLPNIRGASNHHNNNNNNITSNNNYNTSNDSNSLQRENNKVGEYLDKLLDGESSTSSSARPMSRSRREFKFENLSSYNATRGQFAPAFQHFNQRLAAGGATVSSSTTSSSSAAAAVMGVNSSGTSSSSYSAESAMILLRKRLLEKEAQVAANRAKEIEKMQAKLARQEEHARRVQERKRAMEKLMLESGGEITSNYVVIDDDDDDCESSEVGSNKKRIGGTNASTAGTGFRSTKNAGGQIIIGGKGGASKYTNVSDVDSAIGSSVNSSRGGSAASAAAEAAAALTAAATTTA